MEEENTTLSDVIESFESSFMDKKEIPQSLEKMWFNKAVGQYSKEIVPLEYDEMFEEFTVPLDRYIIDTLAAMMKVYYLEREVSRVNKIASIVSKDISVNGTNGLQKYASNELSEAREKLRHMLSNQKPSAYN